MIAELSMLRRLRGYRDELNMINKRRIKKSIIETETQLEKKF